MSERNGLTSAKVLGTGLAFIARNAGPLHFGHALVTLNTALLVVVALHLMKRLENSAAAWAGFTGGSLAVLGTIMLAADKGALCLSRSAFDTLSDHEFSALMPGLLALFAKKGWVWNPGLLQRVSNGVAP